ncbi:MAG: DUF624 domain-containing protein [Clostridiales bacterium]|nr:DUF624 domain-containing protein [Clostridiales bacterium]
MAKGSGGGFFRMDGPFIRYGNLVFDFIFLNILWLIVSGVGPALIFLYLTSNTAVGNLPPFIVWPLIFLMIIHWGPASTAMYYTMGKKQRGTDSYTFRDYWTSYKREYKQALIVAAIITALVGLVIYNIWFMYINAGNFGGMVSIIIPLEALLGVEILFVNLYIHPMLARFEMPTKELFRNSFFMANKHLPFTILCAAVFAGAFALIYYVHIAFIFIIVSVYCYIAAAILERVFKNYMPDEDLELEQEDLGDFSISAERQAIIDRYLGRSTEHDDAEEGGIVLVDEEGNEIHEEDYRVVKVDKDDTTSTE